MNGRRLSPDLYVLDALANDIEDLESIERMLNSDTVGWAVEWGRPFERHEVIESLHRLVAKQYVDVLVLAADGKTLEAYPSIPVPRRTYENAYFIITERGRLVHRNWNPEVPDES